MENRKLTAADIGRYLYVYDKDVHFFMIGLVTNEEEGSDSTDYRAGAIYITSNKEFRNGHWCYATSSGDRVFRNATEDEINWLRACIIKNCFIKEEDCRKTYNRSLLIFN